MATSNSLCYAGEPVDMQLFGVRYGATVMKEPLYDPKNEKIKA